MFEVGSHRRNTVGRATPVNPVAGKILAVPGRA
jgi:hypothetical protein